MIGVLRRNPAFRRLWLAQVVSQGGDWLTRIALIVMIGRLSDAAWLGGMGLLFGIDLTLHMLPSALFSPLAGPLADRLSRKSIMIAADLLRALVVLGFLVVDEPGELPWLFVLMLLQMGLSAFFDSARSGAMPNTVRREDLHEAYTLTAATWSMMLAVGAVAGGFLLAGLGLVGVFVIDSATFLLSAWLLRKLRVPPTPKHPQAFRWRDVLLFDDMRRAFNYLRVERLLPYVGVKMFWGTAGGFLVLLSIAGHVRFGPASDSSAASGSLDHDALAATGKAVMWLYCARGLGTGLGPIIARFLSGSSERALRRHISLGFMVGAAGYSLLGFASTLPQAFGTVLLAHTGGSTLWVASTTLWQRHVADAYRGRVHSLDFLGLTIAFSVLALLVGWCFDLSGSFELALWINCGVTALSGLAWTLWARRTLPALTAAGERATAA
jgi:MFS family permease